MSFLKDAAKYYKELPHQTIQPSTPIALPEDPVEAARILSQIAQLNPTF